MPVLQRRLAPTMRSRGLRVYLRAPRAGDAGAFVAAAKASRELHGSWVRPPSTPERYAAYVRRNAGFAGGDPMTASFAGMLVCRCSDDTIVGVCNLSEIVRGPLQSAFLGYYAFAPHAGAGYMSEGLELALRMAFRTLRLHRVEANVQPANRRSLAFVMRAGFAREGLSRGYLKVAGRWRDHVRLAITVEAWRRLRKAQP